MKTAIHWFRRDLRLTDNTALFAAVRSAEKVVPVFILSGWKGAHRWTGPNRQQFLCGCLDSLAKNLVAIGGRLIIRQGNVIEELARLARETGAGGIFFNRDPDPFGRRMEEKLFELGRKEGLEIRDYKDVCLHERDEVLTAAGGPFRVFTPYARAWAKLAKPAPKPAVKRVAVPAGISSLGLPTLKTWGLGPEGSILPAGEKAARQRMKNFLSRGLAQYAARRDMLAEDGTSRLSQDLRFGLISSRELFQKCETRATDLNASGRGGATKYAGELIWREFYMNILWHFPEVLEKEFDPKFRGLAWPGKTAHFARWCVGETGFPIVDAAMRQLNRTGFMHNRARMITAMFLTKDLHLDWRLGESYFMQKLTDGEIASNNGGWQWSAGTGADAAPYFRIQNPWTQTQRYDPEGAYIKEWIPELRDVPPDQFYRPPDKRLKSNYPAPMVDHAEAREKALWIYKASSEG